MTELAFFSSPIGLGHATRDVAIAQSFENIIPRFVSGDAAARYFDEVGFTVNDAYKPPSFDVENGILRKSASWLWRYYQYYKDCKNIARDLIKNKHYNLIVSDEDFASLTVAQENKIPTVLITDILQTRFTKGLVSVVEKKMNQSMRQIIQRSDAVIMPEYGRDEDNIKRVGPIVRRTSHTREELRQKFGFDRKTIVISVGGTSSGLFLIEKSLEALSNMKHDFDVVVVAGPSLRREFSNVRNLGFVTNLHEIIFASDLLVSLAGKSTIDEANAYGTPGIFIPIKDHFEQEDNAKELGFVFNDVHRLGELILEKIQEKRKQTDTNGALRAAQIIQDISK